jgi:quercetin dioxygenase-like cupin family protein
LVLAAAIAVALLVVEPKEESTMNRFTRRVVRLAAMAVGAAGLLIAVNAVPGGATPPSPGLFTSQLLGRGTYTSDGTLPIKQGTDVVVAKITVNPGGFSGWHSHPGGAIVVVQQGAVTLYKSVGSQCEITTYTKGQAFVERPGELDDAVNKGSTDYIIFVTFPGVPVGGASRIDEPNPGTCPV